MRKNKEQYTEEEVSLVVNSYQLTTVLNSRSRSQPWIRFGQIWPLGIAKNALGYNCNGHVLPSLCCDLEVRKVKGCSGIERTRPVHDCL